MWKKSSCPRSKVLLSIELSLRESLLIWALTGIWNIWNIWVSPNFHSCTSSASAAKSFGKLFGPLGGYLCRASHYRMAEQASFMCQVAQGPSESSMWINQSMESVPQSGLELLELPMCLAQCALIHHLHPWTLRIKLPLAPGAPTLPSSLQTVSLQGSLWDFLQLLLLLFPAFFLPFFGKTEMQTFSINKISLFYSKQIDQPVTAAKHFSVAQTDFINGRDKFSCMSTALHQAWRNAKQNIYREKGKKKHLWSLDDQ